MNRLLPERKHALLRLRKECRPVIQFPISYPFLICLFSQSLCFFHHVLDRAYVQESLFGILIHLTTENHLEPANRFFERNHHTGNSGKLFGNMERLRQEPLRTACTGNDQLIFVRQLIHAHNSDNIL